jgi:zinc transporter, ZIP family
MDVLVLLLAATATALATGIGAIPVFYLGTRAAQLTPPLLGFAAGVTGVAAIAGLLIPSLDEGGGASVALRHAAGFGFLLAARRRLGAGASFMGRDGPGARTSAAPTTGLAVGIALMLALIAALGV